MGDLNHSDCFTLDTASFVKVSQSVLRFGKQALFPGSIEEIDLTFELKDEQFNEIEEEPYILRAIAHCNNK